MIKLRNITKRYHTAEVETTVFSSLNLLVEQGDLIAFMGESGSGKSTLLRLLGLVEPPDGGEYLFEKMLVPTDQPKAVRRIRSENFGFVFQDFHLVGRLRAIDNVLLPVRCVRPVLAEDRRRALELLERVGLKSRARHYPNQLSGGQQQRVAIARALIRSPKILLADEPTGNLDSGVSKEVMSLLGELNSKGTTVVLATHSEIVASEGGRVVQLVDGELR